MVGFLLINQHLALSSVLPVDQSVELTFILTVAPGHVHQLSGMAELTLFQEIYAELKAWQAGLGAIIGFAALAGAAWYNFHLNRKRDRQLREAEARSVAAAIYSEIIPLRDEMAKLAKVVAHHDKSHGGLQEFPGFRPDVYRLNEPVVFPRLAEKFGTLEPDLAVGISRFYANLDVARKSLDVLISPQKKPRYSSTIFLRPAVAGVEEVQPALRKMERMLHLPERGEPDTGHASALIEVEAKNP